MTLEKTKILIRKKVRNISWLIIAREAQQNAGGARKPSKKVIYELESQRNSKLRISTTTSMSTAHLFHLRKQNPRSTQ